MKNIFKILFILSFGCNYTSPRQTAETLYNKEGQDESYFAKGIVSLKNTDENLEKSFSIYNHDGSVYASISLKEESIEIEGEKYVLSDFESKRNEINKRHHFAPINFYPSSGYILQFAYQDAKNGEIRIFLNKDKSITKYLKLDDSLFTVRPWREYLKGSIVEFDSKNNPLLQRAENSSEIVKLDKDIEDVVFSVVEVKDNFIKVECTDFCDVKCGNNKIKGWIKWRDNNHLLIRFILTC